MWLWSCRLARGWEMDYQLSTTWGNSVGVLQRQEGITAVESMEEIPETPRKI